MDLFLFIHPAEHEENTADNGDNSGHDGDDQMGIADVVSFLPHIDPNLPHSHACGDQTDKNTKHIFHNVIALREIEKVWKALVDHCRVCREP